MTRPVGTVCYKRLRQRLLGLVHGAQQRTSDRSGIMRVHFATVVHDMKPGALAN